jgi:rod shape determining protein RodA
MRYGNHSLLLIKRLDWGFFPILAMLMAISLFVISAYTAQGEITEQPFLTPLVRVQLQWFFLGTIAYFAAAIFDYNRLREWTWLFYVLAIIALVGLFFTPSVQRVHRWYKLPFIGISLQPSESAKLAVVMALSWFLERRSGQGRRLSTIIGAGLIVGIPFLLILKQPDLGTALVLFPMTWTIFYFGNVHPLVLRVMAVMGFVMLTVIALLFLGIVTPEQARPYATRVMKDYQFERLNPNTHQQKAAVTAIAIGGLTGTGWRKSTYTSGGWLPTPYTDSVFPAYGEEFGFIGLTFLLALFYALIYRCFRVVLYAKDPFGRLLAAGITSYLAMHILVNIGMMTGFLPITGVPLLLVSYGGSSILSTMLALGILQSIYARRFMF